MRRRLSTALAMAALTGAQAACTSSDVAALRLIAPAVADAPRWITIDSNLTYAERASGSLQFDLYRPAWRSDAIPLVIVVHGGSWSGGRRSDMLEFAYDIAAQGYAAATIDYRLVNRSTVFPAPVADVLEAVRYFRAHAPEYRIDPARVALLGLSAGGNLALLAGMTNDTSIFDPQRPAGEGPGVTCVVDLFGPTDFTVDASVADEDQIRIVSRYLGVPATQADPALKAAASPVSYARADGPAILIVQGTADTLVPPLQSETLAAVLDAAGQAHVFVEISGMGHLDGALWVGPWAQRYRRDIFAFLSDHL